MPLEEVITVTVLLIFIAVAIASVIILAIADCFDDPVRSRMIFVIILSIVWIIAIFVASVCKGWSAGDFDHEPKSEPQTESSAPKLDYEKN